MKFTCCRQELLNSINMVFKAVPSRTTLPILECILINASPEGVSLMANDLEMGIKSSPIDANVEQEGIIALEAKMLLEIIRRLSGEDVTITSDENNLAIIDCDLSQFKICGQDGYEFPELPNVEKDKLFTMPQSELKNMIKQTIFSVSQDESKPVFTGELIEIMMGGMNIVSVDGFRISHRCYYNENNIEASFVVPSKTLSEVSKILSDDGDVTIYFTDRHILFELKAGIVVSRLIEGNFIKYEQSFIEEYKTKVTINRTDLITSLERASLISRDTKKTPVKLEIKSDAVIITSNTEMGAVYEQIPADIDGEGITIGFNPKFIIEALKVIEDDQISMLFTTHLSPCIIRPVAEGMYKYLILPLRM